MNKKLFFILIIFMMANHNKVYSQIKIGKDKDIHPKALFEVENIDNKGIIIPFVNKNNDLPNYNSSEEDFYNNNPDDNGLLIYSKESKDIMKYDGYKWITGQEKSILNYKNLSIFSSNSANQTVANVLGITGRPILIFNISNDIDKSTINNLNLNLSEGEIEIKEDGYYRINPSIKINSAGGLSVGNNSIVLSLQAKFLENDDWQKIYENYYLLTGLVVTAGSSNSVNSFSVTKYLKKGNKIRLKGGIQANQGVNLGSGVTFVMNDKDTFLYIEKLD